MNDAFGGFSKPSKTACLSWSIPAEACRTGAILSDFTGSVCSRCYAKKGFYRIMPSVQKAMIRRLNALQVALADGPGGHHWLAFAESMAHGINRRLTLTQKQINRTLSPGKIDGRFFRWFDSGDLQSADHLKLACEIATTTPKVHHFMPTKEMVTVRDFVRARGKIPPNMMIRVSGYFIDEGPIRGQVDVAKHRRIGISLVHSKKPRYNAYGCQGDCSQCRVCWTDRKKVSYHLH